MEKDLEQLLLEHLKAIHDDISSLKDAMKENALHTRWMEIALANRSDLAYPDIKDSADSNFAKEG